MIEINQKHFKKVVWIFIIIVTKCIAVSASIDVSPLFPGTALKCKYVLNFDRYTLPLGKLEKDKFVKSKTVEGKIIQYTYAIPANYSIYEIYKNYEKALNDSNFKILFTLSKEEEPHWSVWADRFFESTHRNPRCGQDIKYSLHYATEAAFIAAETTMKDKKIYISVCMAKGLWHGYTTVQQDIIEIRSLKTGFIRINAKRIIEALNAQGHMPIYQIHFDFDKAKLRPESEPVIKEIAKLLKQNPHLKLYVVGHTDNMGSLEYNMKLSKARAQAVVNELITKYKISSKRLKAFGVGPLCPVASNDTEEGRAKNRRVELVKP